MKKSKLIKLTNTFGSTFEYQIHLDEDDEIEILLRHTEGDMAFVNLSFYGWDLNSIQHAKKHIEKIINSYKAVLDVVDMAEEKMKAREEKQKKEAEKDPPF